MPGSIAGEDLYAPLIASELEYQLESWYQHLPNTLKFDREMDVSAPFPSCPPYSPSFSPSTHPDFPMSDQPTFSPTTNDQANFPTTNDHPNFPEQPFPTAADRFPPADDHIAFLRTQYYGCQFTVYWPATFQILSEG